MSSQMENVPTGDVEGDIHAVLQRMRELLVPLEAAGDPKRHFLATYSRTTAAVAAAIRERRFEDARWVDRWDVAFAELYVDALEAYRADPASAARPWRVAFGADPDLPPLIHVLLGINAHVNYDLPQALLDVITPADFEQPDVVECRRRDHQRIDEVLASRVNDEDAELQAISGARTLTDRLLQPFNRAASRRFLREARRKVWHNTVELNTARVAGDGAYRDRLRELDVLTAARVADLLAPGNVLIKLGIGGFGVLLPPL